MAETFFAINQDGYNLTKLARHEQYPPRVILDDEDTAWSVDVPHYNPARFTHQKLLNRGNGDETRGPADVLSREAVFATVEYDFEGYPLNPHGRTGLAGRGLLRKYGANVVANVVATDSSIG